MSWMNTVNLVFILVCLYKQVKSYDPSKFRSPYIREHPCYDIQGKARFCQPEFYNTAFGLTVQATCNEEKQAIRCQTGDDSAQSVCKCDSSPKQASFLTDLNNQSNATCWTSGNVPQNVNISLNLSLGKLFEVMYISLQFCEEIPKLITVYKSMDFGHTWIEYQHYPSVCQHASSKTAIDRIRDKNSKLRSKRRMKDELGCTKSSYTPSSNRISFSTMNGRTVSELDYDQILQEWISATDLKVVFHSAGDSNRFYNVAVSDLAVGGRCQCNGHASRCVTNRQGRLVCDCQHSTEGDHCERCKAFHHDTPYKRGTAENPNACLPCQCNLHANKCLFNMGLYKLSGGRRGGVCIRCRHNTEGRHCHYCKEGFYRDPTKDIAHGKVCKVSNSRAVELIPLISGVPVNGVSSCMGATDCFYIDTATDMSSCLTFSSYNGKGTSPFYIKKGALPNIDHYDYKQDHGGTEGKVFIPNTDAGSRYFMCFFGTIEKPFVNVTLLATRTIVQDGKCGCSILCNGVTLDALSSNCEECENARFTFKVPDTECNVTITSDGDGDMDLYVQYGSEANVFSYEDRPYTSTSKETISITNATKGEYHILLYPFEPYQNVSLSYNQVC